MTKLLRTKDGPVVQTEAGCFLLGKSWDDLVRADDVGALIDGLLSAARRIATPADESPEAPVGTQEIWAAGVTYMRSRVARMEESQSAGGGDFYDRVYVAPRPELFFKAPAARAVGPNARVRIRRDSKWNVPEPELVLVINPRGKIIGYTIGNDMSSRDIEGENPLYLPQAKCYDGGCAIGPAVLLSAEPLPKTTQITMEIARQGKPAFTGTTSLAQMKREPNELIEYLFRETTFAEGCYLLTGTGIVPPDSFTLDHGDEIRITIEPIGTLRNIVE